MSKFVRFPAQDQAAVSGFVEVTRARTELENAAVQASDMPAALDQLAKRA